MWIFKIKVQCWLCFSQRLSHAIHYSAVVLHRNGVGRCPQVSRVSVRRCRLIKTTLLTSPSSGPPPSTDRPHTCIKGLLLRSRRLPARSQSPTAQVGWGVGCVCIRFALSNTLFPPRYWVSLSLHSNRRGNLILHSQSVIQSFLHSAL